jgi:hypothetical protein
VSGEKKREKKGMGGGEDEATDQRPDVVDQIQHDRHDEKACTCNSLSQRLVGGPKKNQNKKW